MSHLSPPLAARPPLAELATLAAPERLGAEHGFRATIRVDQGTEFVSRDVDLVWPGVRDEPKRQLGFFVPQGVIIGHWELPRKKKGLSSTFSCEGLEKLD